LLDQRTSCRWGKSWLQRLFQPSLLRDLRLRPVRAHQPLLVQDHRPLPVQARQRLRVRDLRPLRARTLQPPEARLQRLQLP
jgi:hypothetical protein